MNENVTLVFDMDGTVADLFNVDNWESQLRQESTNPYEIAEPLVDMPKLCEILEKLKDIGFNVAVTSWTAKGGTKDYNKEVRAAKIDWLNKWGFPYDEIHIVKYGSTKANATRNKGGFQILFDDNERVRKGWNLGSIVDAKNVDIVKFLERLV